MFFKVATSHRDGQTKLLHGLGPAQVKALSSRLSVGSGIFGSRLGAWIEGVGSKVWDLAVLGFKPRCVVLM